jgi:hypothetical protein
VSTNAIESWSKPMKRQCLQSHHHLERNLPGVVEGQIASAPMQLCR